MLSRSILPLARPLRSASLLRSFATSTPTCSKSEGLLDKLQDQSVDKIAAGEDEDAKMAQKIKDAKGEMVKLGFHGGSIWTQVICWGDQDCVSFH
jgi:hypothetical protein